MKTWAALCVGLCLWAGQALAQDSSDKTEAPIPEAAVNTPADSGLGNEAKSDEAPAPKKKATAKKDDTVKKSAAKKDGSAAAAGEASAPKKSKSVKKDTSDGNGNASTDQGGDKPKKKAPAKKESGEPKKETTASVGTDPAGDAPKKKTKKSGGDSAQADSGTAKKPAHGQSGTAVYKEGGKTCSGLDDYKICW